MDLHAFHWGVGRAGSLLLCVVFLATALHHSCFVSCRAQAPGREGFTSCGAQA